MALTPISAGQLAKHWGTSKPYVFECKRKGCPMTSLEAADDWRRNHTSRAIGKRAGSPATASKKKSATSTRPKSQRHQGPQTGEQATGNQPPPEKEEDLPPLPVKDLSTIEASLQAAIEMQQDMHRLMEEAKRRKNDGQLSVRQLAYNKARDGRMEEEEMFLRLKQSRGELISLTTAKDIFRKARQPLINALRRMGSRLNISGEIEQLLGEVQLELRDPPRGGK